MDAQSSASLESTRELVTEFRAQVQRTADWLNSTPLDQLARATDGPSIADRAYSSNLAIVRSIEAINGGASRDLPRLAVHGVGSQLAVVGEELAAVAETSTDAIAADLALMARISDLLSLRTNS
ncbi:MAG: hypothetical protein WA988_04045 [Candidatus Nanopelagicales bacterium]